MQPRSILLVAAALAACPRETSTTTTSSEQLVNGDEATARLTRARCDREETCDNIGEKRAFVNRDACTHELERAQEQAPLSRACPRGMREALLEDCLSEVRREECGNPHHLAERIDRCKIDELCRAH